MAKIFNDLAYAQRVDTYAGLPLEAADETAGILEQKYHTAKDTHDKLKIAIANLPIYKQDEWVRNEAANRLNTQFSETVKNGNWEDAPIIAKTSAMEFASDRGVIEAMKSKANGDAMKKALADRIGKDEKDGGILQEDYDFELAKADNAYKGVRYNEKTGAWEGHYALGDVPKYINIGNYVDKFLEGYKPNTGFGGLMKGEDGKWYKTIEEKTESGTRFVRSTEEASYDEIYKAARAQALQNSQIDERVGYDSSKDMRTLNDVLVKDPSAVKAMKNDLITVGYTDEQIANLTDQEVLDLHKKEMQIHQGIVGPVNKAAYIKETMTPLGLTYEQQKALKAGKKASGSGGDEKVTPKNDYIISQHLTQGYSDLRGYHSTVSSHKAAVQAAEVELRTHDTNIKKLADEIAKQEKAGKVSEGLVQQYENALTAREQYANSIQEMQLFYNQAVDKVEAKYGNQRMDWYNTVKDADAQNWQNNIVSLADKLDNTEKVILKGDGTNTMVTAREAFLNSINGRDYLDGNFGGVGDYGDKEAAARNLKRRLLDAVNARGSKVSAQDIENMNHTIDGIIKTAKDFKDITADMNAELQKAIEDKSSNYAYVYLGTAPVSTGKQGSNNYSNFSNQATSILRDNIENYQLITADGKTVTWSNETDGEHYDKKNVRVIGYTTEPVGQHGYCVVAIDEAVDDNGNPTGKKKELIFKPKNSTADGIRKLAEIELKTGYLEAGQKPYRGFQLEHSNDVIALWQKDEVDRQLAIFQDIPLNIPKPNDKQLFNSDTREVYVGARYKANVTRKVDALGNMSWDVTYQDRTTGQTRTEVDYPNLNSVEKELELIGGSTAYQVPLSDLRKIYTTDLTNGKVVRNGAANYLNSDFYNELKKFDKNIKMPYEIENMLRSNNINSVFKGGDNNEALVGKSVDLVYDDKLASWLKKNSVAGNAITGTNLLYNIIDVKGKKYVNIKMK